MARRGTIRDIANWHSLHRSLGPPYPAASWRLLPEIWRSLLSTGRLQLFLVEDRSNPRGSAIIACCAAVFVTDAFCRKTQSAVPLKYQKRRKGKKEIKAFSAEAPTVLSPYLEIELVRLYLSRKLPVLTRSEIARANAGQGLNVLVCFSGLEKSVLPCRQSLALRKKRCAAFDLALSGYQVKEFLANPIGQEACQEAIDGGAHLRRDYSKYFRRAGLPMPESLRPRLVGLTREEAAAHPGSHLAGLFGFSPPRFHFCRSQQALLRRALDGETHEEEASSLHISLWTVKKRWHDIYERVASVDSDLLPSPTTNAPQAHPRGAERRRRLLTYLRQHPEELRPFEHSTRRMSWQEDLAGGGGGRLPAHFPGRSLTNDFEIAATSAILESRIISRRCLIDILESLAKPTRMLNFPPPRAM